MSSGADGLMTHLLLDPEIQVKLAESLRDMFATGGIMRDSGGIAYYDRAPVVDMFTALFVNYEFQEMLKGKIVWYIQNDSVVRDAFRAFITQQLQGVLRSELRDIIRTLNF